MNFRASRKADDTEINLAPLVDMVFLLLVFFMVTTTFKREAEIQINLPEASGEQLKKESFVLEIAINSQGHYFVNQRRVRDNKVDTLIHAIKVMMADNETAHVLISSDKDTPYQAVVTAMDAVRQIGLNKFSLTVKQGDDN